MGCFVLLNPKFMVKRTKWPTSVLLNFSNSISGSSTCEPGFSANEGVFLEYTLILIVLRQKLLYGC